MSIENQFDPDERRIEAMMDGSGFSREVAEIKMGRKVVSGATELPYDRHPTQARRRRGNVRDLESDRDHQLAAERAAYVPPSPEQPTINSRGRAQVEASLDDAFGKDRHIEKIRSEVYRLIPINPDDAAGSEAERERLLTARLRTYFDRKSRD